MKQPLTWSTFSAPSRFYALARAANPWLWSIATVLTVIGL